MPRRLNLNQEADKRAAIALRELRRALPVLAAVASGTKPEGMIGKSTARDIRQCSELLAKIVEQLAPGVRAEIPRREVRRLGTDLDHLLSSIGRGDDNGYDS